MNKLRLIFILLAAGVYSTVLAAPPEKPPAEPQDVNVINTPDVNVVNTPNVNVTNPVTSVTVDNTAPIPVSVQNQSTECSSPQFIGFTTTTFDGGQGVVTYTNACQQEYPGSWMCSSEEFINSRSYPASAGRAWIRPTNVPVSMGTGATVTYVAVQDISGVIFNSNDPYRQGLSCIGWSDIGWESYKSYGLTVDETGKYGVSNCADLYKVACCATSP